MLLELIMSNLLLAATTAQASAPAPASVATQVRHDWLPDTREEAAIAALLERHRVPGAQIAVLEAGEVVYRGAFGVRDVDSGEPVTHDTLFQAASLNKPVFSYAVLQLVAQGRLGLDDRLADYVVPEDFPEHPWLKLVTVRHVLTHRSGLPNWRGNGENAERDLIPKAPPGSVERYSGEAFLWLQQVVEFITDKSIDAHLQEAVFAPHGIAAYEGWRPEIEPRLASGHRVDDDGKIVVASRFGTQFGPSMAALEERSGRPIESWRYGEWKSALRLVYPASPTHQRNSRAVMSQPAVLDAAVAGSLRTSASDYARFMALLMPHEELNDGRLPEGWRNLMMTPQFARPHEHADLPMGMGLFVETSGPRSFFYHGGNNGGRFQSFMYGEAATGRGIVVFTNGPGGYDFYADVLDLLLDVRSIAYR
ncbi:serine hydrolase domain-containing protein [Sphingomicrobium arenosum]|uniref:serine hydrolase domain-containing protein n=1 Tax=Sphingomicrobium arenosum TaxID=2233861 RepID=UPI002240EB49|nr:serine hydrolase domain-containing protein [Sphingomicrobium arenosum]